jgi:hypothetical protein
MSPSTNLLCDPIVIVEVRLPGGPRSGRTESPIADLPAASSAQLQSSHKVIGDVHRLSCDEKENVHPVD